MPQLCIRIRQAHIWVDLHKLIAFKKNLFNRLSLFHHTRLEAHHSFLKPTKGNSLSYNRLSAMYLLPANSHRAEPVLSCIAPGRIHSQCILEIPHLEVDHELHETSALCILWPLPFVSEIWRGKEGIDEIRLDGFFFRVREWKHPTLLPLAPFF